MPVTKDANIFTKWNAQIKSKIMWPQLAQGNKSGQKQTPSHWFNICRRWNAHEPFQQISFAEHHLLCIYPIFKQISVLVSNNYWCISKPIAWISQQNRDTNVGRITEVLEIVIDALSKRKKILTLSQTVHKSTTLIWHSRLINRNLIIASMKSMGFTFVTQHMQFNVELNPFVDTAPVNLLAFSSIKRIYATVGCDRSVGIAQRQIDNVLLRISWSLCRTTFTYRSNTHHSAKCNDYFHFGVCFVCSFVYQTGSRYFAIFGVVF